MALVCLPKFAADAFRSRLTSGEIDPVKLSQMSSAERRVYFESFLKPEEAKMVNANFESKLLLKNQQQGMITWAKKMAGISQAAQRDLVAKIEKLQKALDPEDQQMFLADLAEQKLGVEVSPEEASSIVEAARKVKEIENAQGRTSIEYGRARVAFDNLMGDLKSEALGLKMADFKDNPVGATGKLLSEISGNAKAIKSTLDNSALFRQGWKVLMTSPGIWLKNARASFSDLVRTFGGQAVMDEIKADIYARKNYDLYKKSGLAVGVTEEAFPTHLPEKVPGLGRAFKSSET